MRGLVLAVVAWMVIQVPSMAYACSVCSAGRDEENAAAFLLSTIFMSLTPLIAIGGIVYLLIHRFRKFEAEQQARRDSATASASTSAQPSSSSIQSV